MRRAFDDAAAELAARLRFSIGDLFNAGQELFCKNAPEIQLRFEDALRHIERPGCTACISCNRDVSVLSCSSLSS